MRRRCRQGTPMAVRRAAAGGEFMGTAFSPDMWLHPEQSLVKMAHGPALESIELLTPGV